MKYNVKNKLAQIDRLESSTKAKEFIESASNANLTHAKELTLQKNHNVKPKDKKYYTFYLSESLLQEVEAFLNEFGVRGETKGSFIEDSLRFYLSYKQELLAQELEDKLKKLKNKSSTKKS